MSTKRIAIPNSPKFVIGGVMLVALLTVGSLPFFSRARVKNETIEGSAMGTSTQLGQVVGVSIEIYDFSTPDDHQLLATSFEKGQNNGLVTQWLIDVSREKPSRAGRLGGKQPEWQNEEHLNGTC